MQVLSTCEKNDNLTYKRPNSVIKKNAIILNIIHNIFNLRDTEKIADVFIHYRARKYS
jgi:hypothetical protein